jgi:hypothetical protein
VPLLSDSPLLRELAGLSKAETEAAREIMPAVLSSLGCPLPVEGEFADRCGVALHIVHRDLDTTGYGRYRLHPHNAKDAL